MWELSSKLTCPIKKHTIKQIPWHPFINNPSVSIKTFLGFQTEFLLPLMAVMITVFSRNNLTFTSSQEERCLLGHCITVETSNVAWKYLNPSLFILILSCFPPHTSVRWLTKRTIKQFMPILFVKTTQFIHTLREELKAWPVVIVSERTHYWVIRASDQGSLIKEDGFNTLTPESQAACWISGL